MLTENVSHEHLNLESSLATLDVDGVEIPLAIRDLTDRQLCDEIIKQVMGSMSQVIVRFKSFEDFCALEQSPQLQAIDFFIVLQQQKAAFKLADYGIRESFFQMLLTAPFDATDEQAFSNMKRILLSTAVLSCPDALEVSCQIISKRFQQLGCAVPKRELVQQAKQLLKHLKKASRMTTTEPKVLKELFPEASIGENIQTPVGWHVTTRGVFKSGSSEPVLTVPVLLAERLVDTSNETESVVLIWRDHEHWRPICVSRRTICDSREIVAALAPYGVPVNTSNCQQVVSYLCAFESFNRAVLPVANVTHKLGWQNGQESFLCGAEFLADGHSQATRQVRFHGRDAGDDQLARGFRCHGGLEDWKVAIEPLSEYPAALFIFYAGFAAPLLPLLGVSNFIIDLAGQTTAGKTTMLQVVGSIWGCSDERERDSVVHSFDMTATFLERASAVLQSMPLLIDDSKLARNSEDVRRLVYAVTEGRGRGRGSIEGLRQSESWRTITFVTGEQPITAFGNDGGARARVMTLWGSPFGENSQEAAEFAATLRSGVMQHYGHAGVFFMQHVLRRRNAWNIWRHHFVNFTNHYAELAGDNLILRRQAPMFGVIRVAAAIARTALQLPWELYDFVAPLWSRFLTEQADADLARIALRSVYEWAVANPHRFFNSSHSSIAPHQGWIGTMNSIATPPDDDSCSGTDNSLQLGFRRPELEKILNELGYEAKAIIRQWKDRNWLSMGTEGGDNRFTLKRKLDDKQVRLVVLSTDAIRNAVD